jgi:DNA polymerase kappa
MTDNGGKVILTRNPYAKVASNAGGQQHPDEPETVKKTHVVTKKELTLDEKVPSAGSAAPDGISASALVIAAADKAGMEGIDRARINSIILRESGSSLFIQQQRRRDAKVDERIASLRTKLQEQEQKEIGLSKWKHTVCNEIDREIPKILSQRPVRSSAVVVDMDMYYMACELLTRPDLEKQPACVGKGMILTSNYLARRYGVRSAMAGWIGDKLVEELSNGKEHLVHVPSNFALYNEKSLVVRKVLAEYDPHLRAYSLDEAYMDLGPYLALKLSKRWDHDQIRAALSASAAKEMNENENNETGHQVGGCELDQEDTDTDQAAAWTRSQLILASYKPSDCLQAASKIVNEMRQRVCDETGGLTCSAGVAPNFMLAKIASDRNKPNGQLLVGSDHDSVVDFLYPLSTRKVSGIGRVTEKILSAFGVQTVRDLYEQRALVRFLFQPASAKFLLRASLGCSSSDEKAPSEEETSSTTTHGQKGISRERTFPSGRSWAEINSKLEDVGRLLSKDMEKKKIWAHTITIKVKLHTFDCLSRSKTLPRGNYLQGADDMVALATDMLREIRKEFKGGGGQDKFNVRLLGIRCSNFQDDDDRSGSNQMNIEKFLESKPPAVQSPPPRINNASSLLPGHEDLNSRSPTAATTTTRPAKKQPGASKTTSTLTSALSTTVNSTKSTPKGATATSATTKSDATAETETTKQEEEVHCPICKNAWFCVSDNDGLNRHVDACLNGSMVRRAAQEESVTAAAAAAKENGNGRRDSNSSGPSKRQRWTDFFGPRA